MSDNKRKILEQYTKAWNDHDTQAILSMMTDDCVFYAIAGPEVNGTPHKGKEKVGAAADAVWKNFPDAAWLDGEIFILDDTRAMVTCRFKATDLDGGKHEAQMVDLYEFDGDKIAVKNAFRKNRPAVKEG